MSSGASVTGDSVADPSSSYRSVVSREQATESGVPSAAAEAVPNVRPKLTSVLRHISATIVFGTLAISSAVLIGWTFDLDALKSLGPGHTSLLPNAALTIALSSIAMMLLHTSHISHRRRQVALAIGCAVALITGLTIIEYAFSLPLGIDTFLFKHALDIYGASSPGRLSAQSAGVLFMVGLGILFIDVYTPRGFSLSEMLAIAALTFSVLGLLGYVYGAETIFGISGLAHISVAGALCYVLLGISILFARPERGLMAIVTAETIGGVVARKLLPAAIVIPILLGWLRLAGQDLGLYDLHEGLSFHVLSTVTLIAGMIWWIARNLNAIDLKRRRSEMALEHAYNDLKIAKEQSEAANNAKDQFLAVLSHELRTPLTPIRTTAEILRTEPGLPKGMEDCIETIMRNVDLEARLIDDLLDLTRISRGKLELHQSEVDLHQTIEQVVVMCEPDLREKDLHLEVSLRAAKYCVRGDMARLQQIFWNLLKNAIKFTPHGGRITIISSNDDRGRVRVELCDTGIGIDHEVLPRIFDAFEQGERTVTRRFGGLGLGLAITKNLVELHEGIIMASSEGKNRGAQFIVAFHALDLTPMPIRAPQAQPQMARSTGQKTILIVDDHYDSRRVLQTLLERRGYRVLAAECVKDAVELGLRENFDLLLSDVGLPDGSGHMIMEQLRAAKPVRGIALSGFGMEEDILKSESVGFSEHFTKPYDFQRLHASIERLLSDDSSAASAPVQRRTGVGQAAIAGATRPIAN